MKKTKTVVKKKIYCKTCINRGQLISSLSCWHGLCVGVTGFVFTVLTRFAAGFTKVADTAAGFTTVADTAATGFDAAGVCFVEDMIV